MALKILILFTLFHYTLSHNYTCSQKSVILLLKRPAYEFSMKILDRAAQNENGHFVFSPLTSWLQLSALAEGAKGETLRQIWNVTRYHKNRCFKLKLARYVQKLTKLGSEFRRRNVIVIDELLAVKKKFIRDVRKFYNTKVMLKNFAYRDTAARDVNKYVSTGTNDVVTDAVFSDDFNNTVMLMSDNVYFRSAWQIPFNPAYTKTEKFLSSIGKGIGEVNMMNQIGYFNMIELPYRRAKVIEIPLTNGITMLLFVPQKDTWVGDVFYDLQKKSLSSIFNEFNAQGPKLVNVKIPRFNISTCIDNLPELLYDMGVRRVFDPNRSELELVSDYEINVSLMSQIADIQVNELGSRASVTAESLVNNTVGKKVDSFVANRPFAYMIVDRKSHFILFAGAYSIPSVF